MKQSNLPQDSGLWAIGNTLLQDLKDMAVVAAFATFMALAVAWFNGLPPSKLIELILGA